MAVGAVGDNVSRGWLVAERNVEVGGSVSGSGFVGSATQPASKSREINRNGKFNVFIQARQDGTVGYYSEKIKSQPTRLRLDNLRASISSSACPDLTCVSVTCVN